ncbi:hypothetical protein AB0958_43320 [Streptomyces sp. NPDC006655]|uniref:hypothetical protein n=1 Tax=Streptomyces sp. NPDC006655 TaxID=3156898 RepID=UPI0034556127
MGPGLRDLATQIVGSRTDLTEVAEHAFLPSAQFAVLLPHTGRAAGDVLQDLAVPTHLHLVQRRDPGMGVGEHPADLAELTEDLLDAPSCHAPSLRDDRNIPSARKTSKRRQHR